MRIALSPCKHESSNFVTHVILQFLRSQCRLVLPAGCLCLGILLLPGGLQAQDLYSDPFAQEDPFAAEDPFSSDFMDPYQSDFQDPMGTPPPGGAFEDPFMQQPQDPFQAPQDQTDQYIDESQFSDSTENRIRFDVANRQQLLAEERQNAVANISYGAGTGLMIGTWFAFIQQETNTRNQFRTIGTSTVLGGVLGTMLGTRSVWDPNAPRPATGLNVVPTKDGMDIAFRWDF